MKRRKEMEPMRSRSRKNKVLLGLKIGALAAITAGVFVLSGNPFRAEEAEAWDPGGWNYHFTWTDDNGNSRYINLPEGAFAHADWELWRLLESTPQRGKAITEGVVTFQVKGLGSHEGPQPPTDWTDQQKQDFMSQPSALDGTSCIDVGFTTFEQCWFWRGPGNEGEPDQRGKKNVFGVKGGEAGDFGTDQSVYWAKFRKNTSVPDWAGGSRATAELKGAFDCDWFGEGGYWNGGQDWDPDKWYHGSVSWNDNGNNKVISMQLEERDQDGNVVAYIRTTQHAGMQDRLPFSFRSPKPVFYFGAMSTKTAAAYPAQPLEARNIEVWMRDFGEAEPLDGSRSCGNNFSFEDEGPKDPNEDLGGSDSEPGSLYGQYVCSGRDSGEGAYIEDPYSYDCKDYLFKEPFSFDIDVNVRRWRDAIEPDFDNYWSLPDVTSFLECYSDKQWASPPAAEIILGGTSVEEGEEVSVTTSQNNWKSRPEQLYKAYFVDDLFYNTVLAGGTPAEHSTRNFTVDGVEGGGSKWSARPACAPITRTPESGDDTDNDGMSDKWEDLVGLDVGRNDAWENPDGDGYIADRFKRMAAEVASNEYYLNPTALFDVVYQGQHRLAKLGSSESLKGLEDGISEDDGAFPNIMEYIAGTNPNDGDTDGDGVDDEEDMLGSGLASGNFSFTATKEPGPDATHSVLGIFVGVNERKRISVVSALKTIEVEYSNLGNLGFVLSASKKAISKGGKVMMSAMPRGASNLKGMAINYEWGIIDSNGQHVEVCDLGDPGDPANCGVGKNKWELGIPDDPSIVPGTEYTVYVRGTDLQTGKTAEERTKVMIGETLNLNPNGCYKKSDIEDVKGCKTNSGSFPQPVVCASDSASGTADYIVPYENMLFTASGDQQLDGDSICTWKLDGEVQKTASGACMQCYKDSSAGGMIEDLTCSSSTTMTCDRRSFLLEANKHAGHEYKLELEITDKKTGKPKAGVTSMIPVKGPEIEIALNGSVTPSHESGEFHINDTGTYDLSPVIHNVHPGSRYSYKWRIDGTVVGSGTCSAGSGQCDSGSQSIDISGAYLDLGKHEIEFSLVGNREIDSGDIVRFSGSESVPLVVESGGAFAFLENLRITATVYDLLPIEYRLVFQITGIFVAFAAMSFAGLVFLKGSMA